MIVTDLDGTLLLPDLSTSPRTRRAITAAQDAGILVVAATGRSVVDMPKVL
ncbi:MAG: HAD hydrolase family protein, partial [Propionicimonas sp.]|nr:HAD hydrolase family protein [Propionicimonas sp.]